MPLPQFTPTTRIDDEVVVFGATGWRGTWHVDRDCCRLNPVSGRPHEVWGRAGDLDLALSSLRPSYRRTPCATCALPALLDLGVRDAHHPTLRSPVRVVLSCPHLAGADGTHRACRTCKQLRALAGRHQGVAHTHTDGYQLLHLTLHRKVIDAAGRVYLTQQVPHDVEVVDAQTLQVAWVTRGTGRVAPIAGSRPDRFSCYQPYNPLNFTVADLMQRPPAPLPSGPGDTPSATGTTTTTMTPVPKEQP